MNVQLAALLARRSFPQQFGAVSGKHGRVIMPGQLWESNDRRRHTLVRVTKITESGQVNIIYKLTGKLNTLKPSSFTTGSRGWSLVKDVM